MILVRSLIKFIFAVLVLFGIYNMFWAANRHFIYEPYSKNIPEVESGIYHLYDEKEDISYNIKLPTYLSFKGSLEISNNSGVSLIIWPGAFDSEDTYGLRINREDGTHQIKIDEHGHPIDGNKEDKEIIEQNKEKVKKFFNNANELWDFKLYID